MSNRFPPSSGFNSRDRSPQRFGRPPVGPRGPDDGPAPFRDPPRGPRALVDSPRGHFGGRGRGYGRGDFRDRDRDPRDRDRDFRDTRDGPPFRRDMDRDWGRRDRDFDPRDNRIGFGRGRSRSPTRDFRDIRDPPGRDFDLGRIRRNSRDSILSASSGGPDGPPTNGGHINRGGMRGRGRGDWEGGRGRGRPPFLNDDRDLFRRRSRSRETWRGRPDRMMDRDRDRDLDRDRALDRDRMMDRDRDREPPRPRDRDRDLDRDLDRRDRFDRREDWEPRRPDREDRDRPVDFWKRDRPPSRAESRAASGSTTSSHPHAASTSGPAPVDRPLEPPVDPSRKASIMSTAPAPEPVRETERTEVILARPEAPKEPPLVVRSSPPPAAPQVPAFGSVSAPIPSPAADKEPAEQRTAPITSQPTWKDRNEVQRPMVQPPTGPKAERGDTSALSEPRNRPEIPLEPTNPQGGPARAPKPSTGISDLSPPTAPAAMSKPNSVSAPNEAFGVRRSNSQTSSPTSTRHPLPVSRAASREPSVSPRVPSSIIPTGPRALQRQAPSPRGGKGSKPWMHPGYPRTPSVSSAPPKQEPIDHGQAVTSVVKDTRNVRRPPSPVADEPESGEIVPREDEKARSPASDSMKLPIRLSPPLDSNVEDVELSRHSEKGGNEEEPAMLPDFGRSSDEEDSENVFTQEYLEERKRIFERDMVSLRAELPPSPLEDPTIVSLLLKIQLLGMLANEMSVEQPAEEAVEKPVQQSVEPVPSVEDEVTANPLSSERVVSFAPTPTEREPEPELEREPEPVVETIIPPVVPSDEVTIDSLPFLHSGPPTPLSDLEVYHDNIDIQNRLKDTFLDELSKSQQEVFKKNAILREEYMSYYKSWRLAIWELDRLKDKKSDTPAPASPPVSTVPTTPAPNPEGREGRRYKGNSELDFLNALKASEISAQEELERRRTKMATARPDLGREAIIPDMLEPHEEKACVYKDVNNIIECNRAMDVFGFLPPPNDFTPEEHITFTDAFMAYPKKWGKIAESLPGRTFQQCIIHYYLTKEEIKYKAKLNKRWSKRKGGPRKGAPRPKSNALIADLSVVKPDFDGEEAPPPVTDTGRPRRAAAPTFGDSGEVEGGPPGRRAQAGRDIEPVERPPARRGRGGGGSRGARRAKTMQPDQKGQILATQDTLPPPLPGTEMEMIPDNIPWGLEARGGERMVQEQLPAMPRGRAGRGRAKDGVYVFESTEIDPPMAVKQAETGYGSMQPTSYWSVPEQRDFPALLAHFGRDFEGISGWMKTKTTVMVKNFYQRRLDSGHKDFELILTEAEEKKVRGELTGPLPIPSVAPKRRYEATPSSIIPRPLAPHGDPMAEVDESRFSSKAKPLALSPQPMAPHVRPASEKDRNAARYQPLAQASTASPVPSTATLIEESTRAIRAQNAGQAHRLQQGPRLGYFTEDRRDSSILPHSTSRAQDLSLSTRHPPGSMPPDMARMEPLSTQGYMSAQQPPSLLSSAHSRHPSLTQPGSPTQLPRPELDVASVHRDPFAPRPYYSYAGQGLSQSPRPGLSPVKDAPRPSVTPAPDASRQVPAKRSNIMSILNDEPEEPQPRKRFASEQAPSAAASTSSAAGRPVYQTTPSSRHEDTVMSGMPQKPSSFAQQSQYQQSSRGYTEYPGYGPPQSGSGTSANNDWMARFDPRAQQTPPQPQAQPPPAQQQSSRPAAPLASQSSYASYASAPGQSSVPLTNLSAPSPAPTPPPQTASQRSSYPNVFSQSSSTQPQPPGASGSREMASQPPSYRATSPGPRASMAYGSRQEPPAPTQSSASLYGVHPRQSGTQSSYSAASTPNPVQSHSYQQHVQTMVSGSHQPQSHRSTPVTLPGGPSQYGHNTPPPQSQPSRSMASLASLGRSYTPPSAMHPSMGGSAMGGYAPPPQSVSGSVPPLHQRPGAPGSLGEAASTPTHHRVYSHSSTQGGPPGSLPPPSQPPR
ncbi:uncharacterized protein N7446_008969 [Penicillium canescens]|uniref:SANT domain-containing protein n=1 Tax=Penicillium canescens TaxID=5083 RepID=A0AAD6N5I0_PENCN|nr:uncharacterized protein N7446_008969 [Penicillium canescens]KAJ6034221.1 hypothetical protein N7460_008396 [Penicillium canescens]KAJ6045884.1 hypothetical protein N7444_007138 [Penicillium canescens]KAJ6052957.1 hypothetical protein N7446_008969 [Penicillium canescens]KAJ6165045.1 hypothetical protein N7485_008289 [Penicillium canescens]